MVTAVVFLQLIQLNQPVNDLPVRTAGDVATLYLLEDETPLHQWA